MMNKDLVELNNLQNILFVAQMCLFLAELTSGYASIYPRSLHMILRDYSLVDAAVDLDGFW